MQSNCGLYVFVWYCGIQEQYEFIHCGLSELVVYGETEVAAANFRIAVNNLKKKGEDGVTGFQRQMKVYTIVCYGEAMR